MRVCRSCFFRGIVISSLAVNRPSSLLVSFIIGALVFPSFGYAEETSDPYLNALISDRPDIADTSFTVGKLRLQLETSFEFIQDDDGGVTTRDYLFPTLLRFGIIEPLEFRIESAIYIVETTTGQRYQNGFSDVSFGFKGHILDAARGGIPSMALLASVRVPTGEDEFSSNEVVPTFLVLADWELPWNFMFGVNLGVDVPQRDEVGDKFACFLYAVVLGYAVHGTNDRLRAFIEVAGASPLKSDKADLRTLDTGITFLITPDIQVDGFVRIGITPSTPDMAGGVGWAFRFF